MLSVNNTPPLAEQLRACSRHLASGVAVVTTCDADDRPFGLTMSAVACLSLEPALFLVCVSERSDTLRPLLERGAFAINLLGREQEVLARIFASKGGPEKFARVAFRPGAATRVPVLSAALAVIECRLTDAYPGGDHRVVIGAVERTHVNGGSPLLHYDGRYLGIEAEGAPSGRPTRRDAVGAPV